MTIEWYLDKCPHHGTHSGEEGPFCFEEDCRLSEEEFMVFVEIRTNEKAQNRIKLFPEERPNE
jgi:uncharacterized membrane protein